jgi:hypothetical protein
MAHSTHMWPTFSEFAMCRGIKAHMTGKRLAARVRVHRSVKRRYW